MKTIEKCLHQMSRPTKESVLATLENMDEKQIGDCQICKYDPIFNPKCKAYIPIKVYEFDVR